MSISAGYRSSRSVFPTHTNAIVPKCERENTEVK